MLLVIRVAYVTCDTTITYKTCRNLMQTLCSVDQMIKINSLPIVIVQQQCIIIKENWHWNIRFENVKPNHQRRVDYVSPKTLMSTFKKLHIRDSCQYHKLFIAAISLH